MNKVMGLNLVLPSDYLDATALVSLFSVLVLIFLFFYLNRYTGRKYFNIWTMGWIFYAEWLAISPNLADATPFQLMLKHWCIGLSAALFFWGSAQFLKLPARPTLFCLFIGFLLVWSYVGAYHLTNQLQMLAPIFGIIGLASLVTASCFYRLRKHQEYVGAGLLALGFGLWGVYLGASPFFANNPAMTGAGFLISAVLQLFIAVSMIILVLEEAKAANEMILNQIRACHLETEELTAKTHRDESQYHGVFDRTTLNEELRIAYEKLRAAQEQSLREERLHALGQMSRSIAHDINNALTPILGYSNLLLREFRDLPEGVTNYIRSIKTAGEKIGQSVAGIRDFYRNKDGRDSLVRVELNAIVQEAVEQARLWRREPEQINEPQVHFEFKPDPSLPRVLGNKDDLCGAFKELITNAARAMPEGGTVKIRTGAQWGGSAPGGKEMDRAFLVISDTGAGMDEETRKRCMEPFFTTRSQQGARGLGLSKVYGIMQRHQGRIEIESNRNKGTSVRLVFPVAAADGLNTDQFFANPSTAALPQLKILCIDDEPSILDVLKIVLKRGGHAVEVAEDGHSGLEIFRAAQAGAKPFDVVFTDLGMPKMDGQQVAKSIKEQSASTPVIMLTGWGGIMQAEGKHPEHIDIILGKPPQVTELIGALRKVMAVA